MKAQYWRYLAGASVLALLAGSCGDDDDDGDSGAEGVEFEGLVFDESDQCGTDGYAGNLAAIEAVDELTVRFTLCEPDVAFPAKVAFATNGIHPREHLETAAAEGAAEPIWENPVGTGPYQLGTWERGNQIVLDRYDDYWGDAPAMSSVVFRWGESPANRLTELQSGAVHGIDNVGTEQAETVESDDNLALYPRDPLPVLYLGFNVDEEPMDDALVRQAVGYAIDRERLAENFYPEGTVAADQFVPPGVPHAEEGAEGYTYDPGRAEELLAEAGYEDGIDLGPLEYGSDSRPYLPEPTQIASDIRDQLDEVGITVTPEEVEFASFIDRANEGSLGLHLLGWNPDWMDPGNYTDYHFGVGGTPQFGTGFDDIHDVLSEAGSTSDEGERDELYAEFNELLMEHAPALPLVHAGSAVAFSADVEGAHASPLANEYFAAVSLEGSDQFVWMQNGEPGGLYCADESSGEALRVCEQIHEPLLGYEVGGTEVEPVLAEDLPESNDDLTEWTFTLREGVTFHDGTTLDADDVVLSYRVQWDAEDPLHTGREGDFTYWDALFGFLNPPAEEEE